MAVRRRLARVSVAACVLLSCFGQGASAQTLSQAAPAAQPVPSLPAGLGSVSGTDLSRNLSLAAPSLGPGALSGLSLPLPQAPAPGLRTQAAEAHAFSAEPLGRSPAIPTVKSSPAEKAMAALPAEASSVSPQARPAEPPQAGAPAKALDAARTGQAETVQALAAPGTSKEGSRAVASRLFEGRGPSASAESPVETAGAAAGRGRGRPWWAALRPGNEGHKSLRGKTLLYIVSKIGGRDYLYEHMVRLSEEYGFELLVLGYPDQKEFAVSKGVKPGNYIEADIGGHSEENLRDVVERVRGLARSRPIDAVKTYLNAYAQLEAELSDALSLPGFSPEAVRAAHTKSLARRRMNAYPAKSIHLPAVEARSPAEAQEAFLKIRAAGYDRAVAKPDSGGGGWGVTLDIATPEEAEEAYRHIQSMVEDLVRRDPRRARGQLVDQKPLVLFEAQIPDGLMLDVEVVLRDGRPAFTFLSYNPPALGNQERGTTYPVRLPRDMDALARRQALKALDAVGLRNGNAHVESILTLVQGRLVDPIVEINARMGGADIWASIRESAGVDVMKEGLFSAFSERSRPKPRREPVLLNHRFLIARAGGRLAAVRGLPRAEGDVFLSEMFLQEGAEVRENGLLGNITVRGKDEASSRDRLFELLAGVEVDIETADGLVTQTGLYGHDSEAGRTLAQDWVALLQAGRQGPLAGLRRISPEMVGRLFARALIASVLAPIVIISGPARLPVPGLGAVPREDSRWAGPTGRSG